jgi:cytoskeletal protein RodZ
MKSIIKQPSLWVVLGILVVAFIILFRQQDENVNTTANPPQAKASGALSNTALVAGKAVAQKPEAEHTHAANSQSRVSIDDKVPRHQDMLSEEMKQAIRDQLFQHGPKRTILQPDGTVIMPSEGRFTQVPVAVQMPDGTIQIKEYSELPE